jgi:hypothetical protein
VREEIPRLVHDRDLELAIFDADVHVQAEDQVRRAPPSAGRRSALVALVAALIATFPSA